MYEYRIATAGFCYHLVKVANLTTAIEDGEVVSPEELDKSLSDLEKSKEIFLKEKERLGFHDGLEFLENANFAGFQLKDGMLKGDTKKLFCIVRPFYEGFPQKVSNFQFEIANLLLAHMQVYEEEKPVKKQYIKNLLAEIKLFFR